MLLSATGLHASGRRIDFPELTAAGVLPDRSDHGEAERGFRTFASLAWRNWTLTALLSQHDAIAPTGYYAADLGDTGTVDREGRSFVELAWTRDVGSTGKLRWRASFDRAGYEGVYVYARDTDDPLLNYDGARGDWLGTQFVYQTSRPRLGILTVGAEGAADLRNLQYNFDLRPGPEGNTRQDVFRISRRRASGGIFVQDEFRVARAWTAYLGGRLDGASSDPWFLAPRAALVYARRNATYKILYGRAFRNPSTFERYWEPNPELAAERITTTELAMERRLHKLVNLTTSVYRYGMNNLIAGVPTGELTLQYRNTWRARAMGVEAEVNGHPFDWLETVGSIAVQRARGVDDQHLQNSPERIAQFRASVPVWRQRFIASGAARYVGSRRNAGLEPMDAVVLADVTATVQRIQRNLDLQFGVRNLLDRRYSDPLSSEHLTRLFPAAGRSVYIKLVWNNE